MGKILNIREIVRNALNSDSDPVNRARMHILFYMMSISLMFTAVLTLVYIYNDLRFQLIRINIVNLLIAFSLYKIVFLRNYKLAAHAVMWMLNVLVWTNIFVLIQAINIITIQYIFIGITCGFYLLNARWGILYSILILTPVMLHFILRGTANIQVYITPQQVSDLVFLVILLYNFFILIFINYHFLKAFYRAILKLRESQHDEKLLNEKLKDAIAVAEASSKAKSDFLSTMSHELRTPLNSVIGMSYVLLSDNPSKAQEENLKVLHFSAESLLSLINDILDFNKLEYGKLKLEQTDFNPAVLIRSIHVGLKHQADEKGLEFKLNLNEAIANLEVNGDPTRLLQILFNLVGNAIKFTPKGKVELSVDPVESDNDYVSLKFMIKDTGIGIPPDQLDIIFEPFLQASSNITRKFGGTGLGLAITRQLLDLHGSSISIDSEEDKGSTFHFIINYKKAKPGQVVERINNVPQLSDSPDLEQLNILVAEDNAMNTFLMRKLFQNWKVNADFVVNGAEAVEKAVEKFYDIILMDIHMPVMDGYEASQKILSFYDNHKQRPAIIALTASVATDIHSKIEEAGLDDYVLKPFNPVELRNKLRSISVSKSNNK